MEQKDKDDIKENLIRNFMFGGVSRERAEKCVTAGSVSMVTWISRWICHNTDYAQTHALDNQKFRAGVYAWIEYKAIPNEVSKNNSKLEKLFTNDQSEIATNIDSLKTKKS